MSKELYYKALHILPERFIDKETRAVLWDNDTVVAANPNCAPIIYKRQTESWSLIEASGEQFSEGLWPNKERYK